MHPLVDVMAVEVIGDHRLRLTFKDDVVGDVSFEDRSDWRGVLEPLTDPSLFAQVRVDPESGTTHGSTASTSRPSRCTPRRWRTASPTRRLMPQID